MHYAWTRSRFNCEFNVAVFVFFFASSSLDACDAHRIVIPAPRGAAFVKQKKNEFLSFLEGARAAGGKLLLCRIRKSLEGRNIFSYLFVYSTTKRRNEKKKRWSRSSRTPYAGCCILGGRRRCSLPASGLIQIASHIERWARQKERERERKA